MWICDCFNNKTNTTASNTFHPESAEFALGVGLQRLGMSKPTPPQRVTRALTWLLFTETCLWAIQTHQILKARSFRFTHCEGGGDGTVADRRGGGQTGGAAEGKSQRTVGLRGNKKNIRHPGRGTHEQRWRERGRNRERAPKGKARTVWMFCAWTGAHLECNCRGPCWCNLPKIGLADNLLLRWLGEHVL